MMSRCFSPGGVAGNAGTTSEPLIDQLMPSTARPKGACARAAPGTVPPAIAGATPAGTCKTSQGIVAAIRSTAEYVAKRGAASFSRSPPFPLPDLPLHCGLHRTNCSGTDGLQQGDQLSHARHMT